jgi:hypothetical protein
VSRRRGIFEENRYKNKNRGNENRFCVIRYSVALIQTINSWQSNSPLSKIQYWKKIFAAFLLLYAFIFNLCSFFRKRKIII